jgi:tetratricopeptide (TPR) repeat protein
VELAKKAVELNPKANNLDTLAAAYAEVGKFEDAITTQGEAIDLLKKQGKQKKMIDRFVERLKSYKAHKPLREK